MKKAFAHLSVFALIFLIVAAIPVNTIQDPYQKVRQRMVRNQIVARGIKDQKVIQAMLNVPRHLFVPESYGRMAYEDRPLPIGEGQTISQPYIVALMTETLALDPTMKVLEIGTGSGYQAAILGEIVREVYSIEIIQSLGTKAENLLARLGYDNIHVRIGDGYQGWPGKAPFDAIIVTCAPTDIPKPLEEQLREGGRMIIPVGGSIVQELALLEKKDGKMIKKVVAPVRFVPMVRQDGKQY
ncbi:MAG: protein-L-isoaspartate(D-aspartate) O-methyltransferase [Bacteroidales bacterium]|jgi:protein-L-isoaspartate(D-aspartate) O-methyltransferase|nr:protein-L-isoaspartate(D-aspartate) O-methyltransferase [Bacteroidales bacterium]